MERLHLAGGSELDDLARAIHVGRLERLILLSEVNGRRNVIDDVDLADEALARGVVEADPGLRKISQNHGDAVREGVFPNSVFLEIFSDALQPARLVGSAHQAVQA